MSEMRRLARLLVARRPAGFTSAHPLAESVSRLQEASGSAATERALRAEVDGERVRLAWGRIPGSGARVIFDGAWTMADGAVRLDGAFAPAKRIGVILNVTSVVLTALLAGCAYAFLCEDVDAMTQVLMPITTAIAILALPFVAVALGSQREAEEAQIERAVRRAFAAMEDEPAAKPRQKWDDEED